MNVKLSVVIITLNEEKNIRRCIGSVQDVADEIVVIDSLSTDATKNICLELRVKFIEHPFVGHIEQKNYALSQATYNHVLSLDADEALDEPLRKEIKKVKENWQADAYKFNRLTNYGGQWVRHCGWYPNRHLRLLDRRKGAWAGVNPHDKICMYENTSIRRIAGDLLHYSYDSVSDHIQQTEKFTSIAAKAYFSSGKKGGLSHIFLRPPWQFFRDYFLRAGFLDGRKGFIICVINSLSVFLKYVKLWELVSKSRSQHKS